MDLRSWFAGKTPPFTCLPLLFLEGVVCSSLVGVVCPSLVGVVCSSLVGVVFPSLVGVVCPSLLGVVCPSLVGVVCGGTTCSPFGLCLAFHSRFSGCVKVLGVGGISLLSCLTAQQS